MNNELIEKIKKLLALSESSNEHESSLALQMAQNLAIKHNIELATVKAYDSNKEEDIKTINISVGKRSPIVNRYVTNIVRNHFQIRIIKLGTRDQGFSYIFVGTPTNNQIAKFVFEFLTHEFTRRWNKYSSKKSVQTKERTSFYTGMYNGLDQKLRDQKKQTEDTINDPSIKNNYSLMIVNQTENLNKAVAKMFPKLTYTKSYTRNTIYDNAYSDGVKQGKEININSQLNDSSEHMCLN
jgi:hypothetical protein